MCVRVHVGIQAPISVCSRCVCVCVHAHVCTGICVSVGIHAQICVQGVCVNMCACECVCVCVRFPLEIPGFFPVAELCVTGCLHWPRGHLALTSSVGLQAGSV